MELGQVPLNRLVLYQTRIFYLALGGMVLLFLQKGGEITLDTSIVDIARVFPCCILFRIATVGLFCLMLIEFWGIAGWIADQLSLAGLSTYSQKLVFPAGLLTCVGLAFAGSTVDTKRMNYGWLKTGSFLAAVALLTTISAIDHNLRCPPHQHHPQAGPRHPGPRRAGGGLLGHLHLFRTARAGLPRHAPDLAQERPRVGPAPRRHDLPGQLQTPVQGQEPHRH
jgi:hypothetical protein